MSLACLCSRAGQFESYLVANPEDRFSRDVVYLLNLKVLTIKRERKKKKKKKKTCAEDH